MIRIALFARRLQKLLTGFVTPTNRQTVFWLSLSLTFSAVYSLLALREAFSSEYVVQDDARQHVFWMMRFMEPDLFPQDWMADYFQSVAPVGYTTIYRIFASLGINPLLFHKLLPPVLMLITTGYIFGVSLQLLPIPITGFISAQLLNYSLWQRDDVISGTPVAFVYPLFGAILYYLLRRSLIPCLISLGLLGTFYPQVVLVIAGTLILRLFTIQNQRIQFSTDKRDYQFCFAGLGVAFLVLVPYSLKSSAFGSTITGSEAKLLHTFSPKGWSVFFEKTPRAFWFCGKRSGMLPFEWCRLPHKNLLLTPVSVWTTLLFTPFMARFSSYFPLRKRVSQDIILLPQVLIASLTCFLIAHALIFKLHLPNRYTEHSFRILIPLAAGVVITLALDALLQNLQQQSQKIGKAVLSLSGVVLLSCAVLFYPNLLTAKGVEFPYTNYILGRVPQVYQFLEAQPKNIAIASLNPEANNLPAFTLRSLVVGGQGFALPYHKKYYAEIEKRTQDLIQAQYSPDLQDVKNFIQQYQVRFWLLYFDDLTLEGFKQVNWDEEYPQAAAKVKEQLQQGKIPALANLFAACKVAEDQGFAVLDTHCIAPEIQP